MDYDREARKFLNSLTTLHSGSGAERRLANLLRKSADEATAAALPEAKAAALEDFAEGCERQAAYWEQRKDGMYSGSQLAEIERSLAKEMRQRSEQARGGKRLPSTPPADDPQPGAEGVDPELVPA
ncbi:MAG: hypothetical protein KF698_08175 [Anaerolineales bacterium]|nr:hypothetical protein [Anaerolineales bacterium]